MLRLRPSLSAAACRAILLAALVAAALAGCWQGVGSDHEPGSQEPAGDDDEGAGNPPPAAACATDSDCVAAATSCCECPAYALPADSFGDPCGDVQCPGPAECPGLIPTCRGNTCILACAPVRCDLVCADGFAADSAGCLQCACAVDGGPPDRPDRCEVDADCVEIAADCCGCALGGADTAVPASQAEGYHEGLGCDPMPSCPGVDVCDPTLAARCVGGACTLAAAPATDSGDGGVGGDGGGGSQSLIRCGTPTAPSCPEGTACVLNDPAAVAAGIFDSGICVPAGG
jgi:hypothetical protein